MAVTVTNEWPPLVAILWNFPTDSSELQSSHETWLNENVAPIVQRLKTEVMLAGSASHVGRADWNHHLSVERLNRVEAFVRAFGPVDMVVTRRIPLGESRARGGPTADRPRDRNAEIWVGPRAESGDAAIAHANLLRRFIDLRRPYTCPFGEQSESREHYYGPPRELLQGFGLTIRAYLLNNTPSRTQRSNDTFLDHITLEPRQIRSGTRGQAEYRRGETEAFSAWGALTPDQRWAIRKPEPGRPWLSRAATLLRAMCSEFKRFFTACFHDLQWPRGECEFYTVEEETRRPL